MPKHCAAYFSELSKTVLNPPTCACLKNKIRNVLAILAVWDFVSLYLSKQLQWRNQTEAAEECVCVLTL